MIAKIKEVEIETFPINNNLLTKVHPRCPLIN